MIKSRIIQGHPTHVQTVLNGLLENILIKEDIISVTQSQATVGIVLTIIYKEL